MTTKVMRRTAEEQEFRQDINGLRAWAVILVILYHFGWKRFSGGYIGVDVFFVISGFLMTRIITRGLETGRFSVLAFYHARAKRILPALLVLCATLLLLGWMFLPPVDYLRLGQHVVQSIFFVSNVQFWREAGYFDVASHEKWLLHTWSLSVEWQFYLLFPLLLVAAWHFRPTLSSVRAAVRLCFVASLAFLLTAPPDSRNAAFFLLPHRAWELLAGGLVFLCARRIGAETARLLEFLGFALILAAANWLESRSPWPGWRTLIPVAGAMLILIAARERSIWTTNPLARWVGNCSYSLYLWHWPIYVGLVYLELESDIWALSAALALTLVLAWWSHRFVEMGARLRLARSMPRTSAAVLALAMLSVVGVSRAIELKEGAPWRIPAEMRSITNDLVMPLPTTGWCFHSVDTIDALDVGAAGLHCELGASGAVIRGLLFGDSHAGHYTPFWDDIGRRSAVALNTVATNWCYPSLNREFSGPISSRAFDQCLINREHFRDHVGDYDFVILAGSWRSIHAQGLLDGVYQAIRHAAARSPLVIIMPAPTSFDGNVTKKFLERLMLGEPFDVAEIPKRSDTKTREANQALKQFSADFDNVVFLERESLFHVDGRASDVTDDNAPFSLDGSHISVYGARKAAVAFAATPEYRALEIRLKAIGDIKDADSAHGTLPREQGIEPHEFE